MSGSTGGFEPWPDDIWEQPVRPPSRPKGYRPNRRHVVGVVLALGLLVVCAAAGWLLLRNSSDRGDVPVDPRPPAKQSKTEPPAPPVVDAIAVRAQLSSLEVTSPVDDGNYDRSAFRHWIVLDVDGCDTRCVILKRQAVQLPGTSREGWWSAYDQRYFSDESDLQIDHVVSLKEAWISGASLWDAEKRELFANDIEGELLAVSASSNEAKGGSDVVGWQPDFRSAWCDLAARVVKTKAKWRLTVDAPEKSKLNKMLATCTGK